MKIKNVKHYGILGKNFTVGTMGGPKTYKKGHKAKTWGLYEAGGEYHVEGHGIGHLIPRELFTTFKKTWDEVETTVVKGVTVVKTTHRNVDETEAILKWFAERDAKLTALGDREERGLLRKNIARLRRTIKEVKNGMVEKRLTEMVARLEALK
jgi:hypothetical protein